MKSVQSGLWCAVLVLAALLMLTAAGCQEQTAEPPADASVPGRYTCTSFQMQNLDLGSGGKWLELEPNGTLAMFLISGDHEASWTLEGETLSLSLEGTVIGTGTLSQGVMTLDLLGAQCTFVKGPEASAETAPAEQPSAASQPAEQQPPAEQSPEEQTPDQPAPQAGMATLECYDGLYRVSYSPDQFTPGQDGMVDLYAADGTQCCLSRLDSEEYVQGSLLDFDTKAADPAAWNFEGGELPTAAGCTARWAVYTDEKGWHSAVIVPFGKDQGREGLPMYAAYMYCSGASREAVWNDAISGLAASLQLGE